MKSLAHHIIYYVFQETRIFKLINLFQNSLMLSRAEKICFSFQILMKQDRLRKTKTSGKNLQISNFVKHFHNFKQVTKCDLKERKPELVGERSIESNTIFKI